MNDLNYFDIIVAACQNELNSKYLQRLHLNEEEQNFLFKLSYQHGVYPFLYPLLNQTKFKYNTIALAQKNMLMTTELIKLASIFNTENIFLISFKGPVLSKIIHGDITSRQYVDLDLLVDEASIYGAAKLLVSCNYRSNHDIEFLKNSALLNSTKDLTFYNSDNAIKVELHWRLFEKRLPVKANTESSLYYSQTIILRGQSIHTLNNESLLVYLCMHGSKHDWERIEWIVDIDRLIRTEKIKWQDVLRHSENLHVHTMLNLGISISNYLFKTPLPDNILNMVSKNERAVQLRDNIIHTLQLCEILPNQPEVNFVKHIKKIASLSDVKFPLFSYLLKITFQIKPGDIYLINLPRSLHLLYFVIRPFRLLYDYTIKKN